MSIRSFFSKQFIDIIQWTESDDETIAWRFPTTDLEIQYGGSLTVRDSQLAIFVNEGKSADVFGPGRYTLTTSTLPILTYLKNWDKLFESPFKSEVYFFSTRTRMGRKWGTPQAISVRDKDFGVIQVRAFGQYSWRIADAKAFHLGVSGTRESYAASEIEDQLKGVVVSALGATLAGSGISFLDMAANQSALGDAVKEKIAASFQKWGLELQDFQLESLSLPDAVQEALDKRMRMGVIGDMAQYARMQAADALPIAAANEGGGVAGLSAQFAAGAGLGQLLAQSLAPQPVQFAPTSAAPVAAPAEAVDNPAARLAQLKSLLDQGLITEADYTAAKQAVLSKLTS